MLVVALAGTVAGCVSVPPEAGELSAELGAMIRASEAAHRALVDAWIDERAERIDRFLREEWFPTFLEQFTVDSDIEADLKLEKTREGREEIIRLFTEAAAEQLDVRRSALLGGLEELRALLRRRLDLHYGRMRIANETLTAHLRAAGALTAQRDELIRQALPTTAEILPLETLREPLALLETFDGGIKDIQEILHGIKATLDDEEEDEPLP